MKRCSRLLIIAWLSSACGSEASKADAPSKATSPTKAQAPTKADPEPAKTVPDPPIERGAGPAVVEPPEPERQAKGDRWRTTLADAKAAGLPPLAFTFALPPDAGMSGGSGNGDYVTLSGPPGGTLMLRITPATVGADPASLVSNDDASTTKPLTVELLGAERPAVAWVSGESMARTSWCGIILAPTGAAEGAPALLLELGIGHYTGEASCTPTLEDDALGAMAKSLVFE